MSDHTTPAQTTRRSTLVSGGRWLTALVVGATLYPFIRFINFKLPKKPVHIQVNKDLAVGAFHLDKDFILFVDAQGPWAVSRKCTHLGCSVFYNETSQQLVCPCHQSKFSVKGLRLDGPAVKNLQRYEVKKMTGDQKGFIVTV
nr:Rieske 2Fe-2S domain-containing protein [Desulfobulbaceae bacterium]